jgi:hypothetical protein
MSERREIAVETQLERLAHLPTWFVNIVGSSPALRIVNKGVVGSDASDLDEGLQVLVESPERATRTLLPSAAW